VIVPDEKNAPPAAVAVKLPKAEAPKPTPTEIAKVKEEAKPLPPLVKEAPAANSPTKTFVAAKETAPPAAGGSVKAQLGAYRSENEALAAWSKMIKKYPDLLSGRSRVVVKADLGARGTYWRLRVPGFANALEAKSFCDKLSAKGQACMIAADK
jgi:hypothetical protein